MLLYGLWSQILFEWILCSCEIMKTGIFVVMWTNGYKVYGMVCMSPAKQMFRFSCFWQYREAWYLRGEQIMGASPSWMDGYHNCLSGFIVKVGFLSCVFSCSCPPSICHSPWIFASAPLVFPYHLLPSAMLYGCGKLSSDVAPLS